MIETAPDNTGLWLAAAVLAAGVLLSVFGLWAVARRRRGWPVALVGAVVALAGALATAAALWSNEILLAPRLDYTHAWEAALLVFAGNFLLYIAVWAVLAVLITRFARRGLGVVR